MQGTACICYWVIFSILLYLLQYSAQAIFGCIHLQQEGPLQVCKGQDRCCSTFLFQHVESFFSSSSQQNRMILQFAVPTAKEVIQRLGYPCEVLYKVAEIPYGSDELTDSRVHHRGSHPCNLFNALLSREHTLGRDLVAQVCYLLLEEVAFGQHELQPVVSKMIKDGLEPCEMVLRHFQVHDHVI